MFVKSRELIERWQLLNPTAVIPGANLSADVPVVDRKICDKNPGSPLWLNGLPIIDINKITTNKKSTILIKKTLGNFANLTFVKAPREIKIAYSRSS